MSLLVKLTVFVAAILALIQLVTGVVGAQLAERQVVDEIHNHAVEGARALKQELNRSGTFDPVKTEKQLKSFFRTHGSLSAVELAKEETGGPDLVLRVTPGPPGSNGPQLDRLDGDANVPPREQATVLDGPDGRYWSVSLPMKLGLAKARLTLEASLAEADSLARKERQIFLWMTFGGLVLSIAGLQLLLSFLIGRPISRMAQTMARVESGQLDVEAPVRPASQVGDEFDRLARGFNNMLARIRGFNAELTERIDQATADLAAKNHTLAELNDSLVAARRDLTAKERLAALGQLAGTIAHELGNPLNAISGHVQLLERNPDLPPEARSDLSLVSSGVKRMTDVIRRFLDSTRGLRPAPEEVDLASLIEEAIAMSLSAEARARIALVQTVAPELALEGRRAAIVTDPSLVRHVLTNLIANAVDAMPAGGRLEIAAVTDDGELRLSVRDTGTGISAEDRRRIFEPFYTTKAKGKGTGLGLAICREIARALKGRIDLETEPGAGSRFTLAIPLQLVQRPAGDQLSDSLRPPLLEAEAT